MEQPKGAHAGDTRTPPAPVHRSTVLSISNTQRVRLPGMQRSVKFADTIQLFEVDEKGVEHRRGPWMRVAVDRHRFRRRIHESEAVIEPILENTHRDRIRNLLCYMCVYE